MNTDLLRRVADAIEEAGDEHFDMNYFLGHTDKGRDGEVMASELGNCGTSGCIAGWTCAVALRDGDIEEDAPWSTAFDIAAGALQLDDTDAKHLFYADRRSVWFELAERYGWQTVLTRDDGEAMAADGLYVAGSGAYYANLEAGYRQITAAQAAEVLRLIADGQVEL